MGAAMEQPVPVEVPSRAVVRRVLEAGADVLFDDGLPPAFLERWIEETVMLLDLTATRDERWGEALRAHARGDTRQV
jgi:hypothetical protein